MKTEHHWVRHIVRAVDIIPSHLFPGEIYTEDRGDIPEVEAVGCDRCGVSVEGNVNTPCTPEPD